MNNINQRISKLRKVMQHEKINAYYISGTDPHSSEYIPEYWQTRAFISGFTGSYGVVIITDKKAGLWTDSRYFIQAKEQLADTEIEMYPLRTPNSILPIDWLTEELSEKETLGIHAETMPISEYLSFKDKLNSVNIKLKNCNDLLQTIWKHRPALDRNKIFELPIRITGSSRVEKNEKIIESLSRKGIDILLLTKLDDIAWTYNLRGSDVAYNPVFLSFALISQTESILFVDENQLDFDLRQKLRADNIRLRPYQHFYEYIAQLKGKKITIDFNSANFAVYSAIEKNNTIINSPSEASLLKMIKNSTEIEGFKEAMEKDGVALIKFLHWLENNITSNAVTEFDVVEQLSKFRSENSGYFGESFATISGYKEHGAIVHYTVNKENALQLEPNGILLLDSGGQYIEGTTDITRTISLGDVSDQQKIDYTLVLKGMINLTMTKFPTNTKGCQLDTIARNPLWQNSLDYGHGTGHGVGHFLNVHEGPISIRKEDNGQTLQSGMIVSNEPGIYREGEYGIRIENLIVCKTDDSTEFGEFLSFETLTLCPIDTKFIKKELLTQDEIHWINQYHKKVREKLADRLDDKLKDYLNKLTMEI